MSRRRSRRGGARPERGFTLFEVLIALWLTVVISLFVMQGFIAAMAHAGRANERAAATTLAIQVMEQIAASANPYTMVGFVDLPRSPLPLPAPYTTIASPPPHIFEVAVDVTQDTNLTLITATVEVYRPTDATPYVVMRTLLDDQ